MDGFLEGRHFGNLVGVGASLWLASFAFAQSQVLVSYEDEMVPVVAMRGEIPVVEIGGERVPVLDARLRVDAANRFTDGAIDIVERNALMGQDYGSPFGGFFFRFSATVRAERDFEDCFVLFVIVPEKGEETYLIREIPDINTKGMERILVTVPVNPGFGGGSFGYRVFSRGEEIRRYEPDDPIRVENMGSAGSSAESVTHRVKSSEAPGRPAKVSKARLLDFPESLMGKMSGGYASAVFSIDRNGVVIELIDVAADHVDFVPEIWKTVVESQYEPGYFEGRPLVTTVKQNFFFNEFAPFSEALEMLPYPELADRDATAIYAPIPNVRVSEVATVRIELLVDTLGRVRNSRIVEGGDTAAANLLRSAVRKWIFLPAIVDGYPAEQSVTIPVAFDIKG